jgi:hypothetical protein
MIILIRTLAIVISLGLWQLTQKRLARRNVITDCPDGMTLTDGIHQLTARLNQALIDNPKAANTLLILSSLVIDLLGFYLLISAIFGKTIEPFLGLFMVFALRQICQAFCPLPPPKGMIWRNPGFPTLLVTYGTSSDLFFSGHTAIAIYGAVTLASTFGLLGVAVGCAIAIFEIVAVLILRAHYTMDVFTGAIAALWVHQLAVQFAPHVDGWISHFAR